MLVKVDEKRYRDVLTFGFWHEQEDKNPTDQTPGGVPAKSALWLKGADQMGPCEGKEEIEAPSRGRRPGHTDFTNVQRERLGRVREGNRSFTGGVEDFE